MPTPTDLFGGAGKGVQLGSGFLKAFSDVKDQFIDNVSGHAFVILVGDEAT